MINFFYEECLSLKKNSEENLKQIIQLFEKEGFKCGDISVVFCSDAFLLSLNKKYLNHDYFTDIITFPYNEGEVIIGDLFVSLDRAKENAIENKETFSRELSRLVIHGFLHLCGFNDKSPEEIKVMRLKEEEYLKLFGFT